MVESLLLYVTGRHSLASILESSRTLRSVIISGFLKKTLECFYYKEFVNSPEHSFMLLKPQAVLPPSTATPPVINSSGLSQEQTL